MLFSLFLCCSYAYIPVSTVPIMSGLMHNNINSLNKRVRVPLGGGVPPVNRVISPIYRVANNRNQGQGPSSALAMVLTTPEAIIESTSTQDLLDDLIDESTRISARRPVILQFDPTGNELWRKWRGTVFAESWRSCIKNMLLAR